jgi:DNA-binding FadR family transcriptional regulator
MPTTAAAAVVRPGAEAGAKRAAKVADLIVEDVVQLGWPVGQVLGSEAELLERYQVSRAVFREAVRLVEHQQVARTRRGPGGGLVVTEPTVGAVIGAVLLYLHRLDAPLDEIFEARIVLEQMACRLVVERAGSDDLERLRPYADSVPIKPDDDPRQLHILIAELSGNAGIGLFVDVFNRVARFYSPDWQKLDADVGHESVHAHAMIARALLDRDAATACRRMRIHLEAEGEYLRRKRSTRRLLPDSAVLIWAARGKGAEAVARRITGTIVTGRLQPGDLVGTEAELMEREGVSRALLREAVRLLEHHHVARMRRGPGGGLFVMSPSADAVTEVAAIYLARRGMTLRQLADVRAGVELAVTELAAARVDEAAAAELHAALAREETATDAQRVEALQDLHAAVALAAQNRALHLVALVLIRLTRLHQVERLAAKAQRQIRTEIHRAHLGIVQAIEKGDPDLARRRMLDHLEALADLLR